MSIRANIAAKAAATTRKLISYGVALHRRSLEGVVSAALADTKAAYKVAEQSREVEAAARQLWNAAKGERILKTAEAVATNRRNSYTISAANSELDRYNV